MFFSDWIIKSSISRKVITLHNDVFYTPISGKSLAYYAHKLINKNCSGIYNISSNSLISKYEFGMALSKLMGISSDNILSGSIKNRAELKFRPTSMGLSNKKISKELKVYIGSFQDQIETIIFKKNNSSEYSFLDLNSLYGSFPFDMRIKSVISLINP